MDGRTLSKFQNSNERGALASGSPESKDRWEMPSRIRSAKSFGLGPAKAVGVS